MGERERTGAPPFGGNFVSRAEVMDADQIRRAVKRMAHEILERNGGLDDLVLVGLQTGGIESAIHLVEALDAIGRVAQFHAAQLRHHGIDLLQRRLAIFLRVDRFEHRQGLGVGR